MLFLCRASIIFLLFCFSADDSCLQMATAPYLGNATAAPAHPNDTTQQTASCVSTRSYVQQELLTRKLARESRQEDSKKNEDSSKPKSNSRSSTERVPKRNEADRPAAQVWPANPHLTSTLQDRPTLKIHILPANDDCCVLLPDVQVLSGVFFAFPVHLTYFPVHYLFI